MTWTPVNFAAVNAACLPRLSSLIPIWLPTGHRRGHEWYALNPTRDDRSIGSFSVNIRSGRWADFATDDRGGDTISLFAYLNGLSQSQAARALAKELGAFVGTSRSPPRHPKLGAPALSHVYRCAEGTPLLVVNRYDKPDQGKTYRPYNIKTDAWTLPERRPLYNLDSLASAPLDAPVFLVEGEKCADALSEIGFLATTVCGGSNGVSKADLRPLDGRKILLWADHDTPGEKYANQIKSALLQGNATVYDLSESIEKRWNETKIGEIPKGWDVADALSDGWIRKDLEMLANAHLFDHANSRNCTQSDGNEPKSMTLWHSPEKEAFATIFRHNHAEHWPVDSSFFRHFLSFEHYKAEGKMLSQSALEDQRRTLTGEALFEGQEHPVFSRIGSRGKTLHLDIGDMDWRSVTISKSGWDIADECPAKFRRSGSMKALPLPRRAGADINALRPFVNVASEADFQMLVAWLVGCFQPKGPYPILILTGEQGSAKSTTTRALRSLVGPADPMSRSAPQSEQDLVIAAQLNHVLAFDNLSFVKPAIADALCRIATGGGFGTRKLHTNAEEVLFNATRPCILNGIPDLASRPDLADRSIIVNLPVIDASRRQFEGDLWTAFEVAAPGVLAALLNAVSCSLHRLSGVRLAERPRMADFARWVTAAEPALGWPEGTFQAAYAANRNAVDSAAIEGNPVAEGILSMVSEKGPWSGTATELIQALRLLYPHLTEDPLSFPRQPNKLSGELKRVQPVLRRQGITLTKERNGKGGQRILHIKHG